MFRKGFLGCAAAVAFGFFTVGCNLPHDGAIHVDHVVQPGPSETEKHDAVSMRAELAKHRQEQIARLEQYAAAGKFPRNRVSPTLINVMRDDEGRLCAVANLIHLDGGDAAIDAAVKQNNFMKIAEQKEGAIHDWVMTSGLTAEEIAFIQAPYMPAEPSADFQKLEVERLQAHFKVAIRMLKDKSEQSLDLAVARLADMKSDKALANTQFATPPGV